MSNLANLVIAIALTLALLRCSLEGPPSPSRKVEAAEDKCQAQYSSCSVSCGQVTPVPGLFESGRPRAAARTPLLEGHTGEEWTVLAANTASDGTRLIGLVHPPDAGFTSSGFGYDLLEFSLGALERKLRVGVLLAGGAVNARATYELWVTFLA
jgi:hypothetical protein